MENISDDCLNKYLLNKYLEKIEKITSEIGNNSKIKCAMNNIWTTIYVEMEQSEKNFNSFFEDIINKFNDLFDSEASKALEFLTKMLKLCKELRNVLICLR